MRWSVLTLSLVSLRWCNFNLYSSPKVLAIAVLIIARQKLISYDFCITWNTLFITRSNSVLNRISQLGFSLLVKHGFASPKILTSAPTDENHYYSQSELKKNSYLIVHVTYGIHNEIGLFSYGWLFRKAINSSNRGNLTMYYYVPY